MQALIASGHTYEKDGALWLATTPFGDDKDRVMRKSDGTYTYFVPDVAYHVTKFERGYRRALNVQGTDHHGTTARVRAGLQALGAGIPQGYPDYVLHNMVLVMKGGEEVKISKRAGSYVTLRDLIDEAGRDAVRYFLVSRKADSEFTFDIDLARAQSDDNPVYYVQYAHARLCSGAARRRGGTPAPDDWGRVDASPLTSPHEDALLKRLDDWPLELAIAAREFAPHRVTAYLTELARDFHSYYNAERVLVDDERLKRARLALCLAVATVLEAGLALLGISAPETMYARAAARQRHDDDPMASTAQRPPRTRTTRSPAPRHSGAGGTLLGIFIGLLLGLGLAAAVAWYLMGGRSAYQAQVTTNRDVREPARDAPKGAPTRPRTPRPPTSRASISTRSCPAARSPRRVPRTRRRPRARLRNSRIARASRRPRRSPRPTRPPRKARHPPRRALPRCLRLPSRCRRRRPRPPRWRPPSPAARRRPTTATGCRRARTPRRPMPRT